MSGFPVIPASAWNIARSVIGGQAAFTFERIATLVKKNTRVRLYRRQKKKNSLREPYYRVHIKLEVGRKTVDLFHNSRAGYRAQYYHSIRNGERANQYLIRQLYPRILDLLKKSHKKTCPPSFIRASLLGPHSKVWIYQGSWLRTARRKDMVLKPKRWAEKARMDLKQRQRKLLRWGSLAPPTETCIDLIGTFVTLNGKPIKKNHKPNRGTDIHEYGFT